MSKADRHPRRKYNTLCRYPVLEASTNDGKPIPNIENRYRTPRPRKETDTGYRCPASEADTIDCKRYLVSILCIAGRYGQRKPITGVESRYRRPLVRTKIRFNTWDTVKCTQATFLYDRPLLALFFHSLLRRVSDGRGWRELQVMSDEFVVYCRSSANGTALCGPLPIVYAF